MPTHLHGGMNDALPGTLLYNLAMVNPATYITYFNDFLTFNTSDWTITTTEAGAGDATEALTDGSGGLLLITNDAADNDADFFQKVGECFRWSSSKDMFFMARFKVSDATQSDWVMGLQITDTSPLDVTDGLFFSKADGTTAITFEVEKNGTATSTAVGTCTTDYMLLGFAYTASTGTFQIFMDGTNVGSSVNTNAVDDEDLTISFGIQNGEAVAKTMTVDYIFAALQR